MDDKNKERVGDVIFLALSFLLLIAKIILDSYRNYCIINIVSISLAIWFIIVLHYCIKQNK